MKYPVRMSSQVMMNAMVDANSNYPSADDIAQALNDGERLKIALRAIRDHKLSMSRAWFTELEIIQKIAADALREGAGDEIR